MIVSLSRRARSMPDIRSGLFLCPYIPAIYRFTAAIRILLRSRETASCIVCNGSAAVFLSALQTIHDAMNALPTTTSAAVRSRRVSPMQVINFLTGLGTDMCAGLRSVLVTGTSDGTVQFSTPEGTVTITISEKGGNV